MIRFRVLHLTVGIQGAADGLEQDLRRLVASLPAPADAAPDVLYRVEEGDGGFTLRCSELFWEGLQRGDVFAQLETDLSRKLVQTSGYALLHAAALCQGDGVYLFGGCSGCGKTTLTTALLQRGFTLLSDEYAPMSLQDRSVQPCPMPLKLLRSTVLRLQPGPELELLEHGFFAKGEDVLYGVPAPATVAPPGRYRVARIYFPWNRPGLGTEAYALQPAKAVGQTMGQILNAHLLGEQAFRLATDLAATVPCFNLVAGDLEQAVRLVCEPD